MGHHQDHRHLRIEWRYGRAGQSNTTTQSGWTIAGGGEYAFSDRFSVKAEYLFVDLGTFDTTIPTSPVFANTNILVHHSYTENIARVGLNYKFR